MTLRIVHGLVVMLTMAVLAALAPAWAGPPTDQLRVQMDRVIKVLEDPDLKREGRQTERRAAIRRLANEIFDFTETTRRSLGQHWQARTPAEREQFVRLYADLLERSYIGKIELYSGERIVFRKTAADTGSTLLAFELVLAPDGHVRPATEREVA